MLNKLIVAVVTAVFTTTLVTAAPAEGAADLLATRHRVVIVTAGDSIVDGGGAKKGEAWPDVLQEECGSSCRVKNVGQGSSCLVTTTCFWPVPLIESFDEDVLARRPDLVLVGIGRNDLCHLKTRDLIAGYQDLRARARVAGVPIRFATITPASVAWQWPCEEQRVEVNDWLRTLDGTLDFEARTISPHGLLRGAFDYGDGLHLNATGYAALGRMAARAVAPRVEHLIAVRG